MAHSQSNLRGILLMVLAMGCFLANDTVLKLAMSSIPPLEALFLRALLAVLLGLPMMLVSGVLRQAPMMFRPSVLLRNVFELAAAAGYVFAIAHAPLADITALAQVSPVLVLLGAVLFFGDRIGRFSGVLVVVAFLGAVLVAQPGSEGFQPFALLGLWSALGVALRDLFGRRVGAEVPALVVAVGASAVSLVGIGVLMVVFERWVAPGPRELLFIGTSSVLLTLGQLLLFTAYRTAETRIIAPFSYTGTIWALAAGALVFGTLPNPLALAGMALILLSGVLVLVLDRRATVAPPAA